MNNNNNSSSHSHHHNPNDHHHHDDQCLKHKLFMCEFCHKVFTTGQALGGHKTSHRSNKQLVDLHDHVNKVSKTMKITFSLSCSPSNHNNDVDAKQKRHSWTRVFNTTVHHHPPTASTFKPSQQQELPAVDLLSLLLPRSCNTKKRSKRYLVQDGLANNNTAPIQSLDMSRDSVVNLDLDHPEYKRKKLSSNGNDSEMMQKQHVLPTTLKPSEQEELPAVDLLSLLPPRSYNTKKRSRRYLIHDGISNNTAPIPFLDMSREPVVNLDLNHGECKRMKLSCNGNDTEMMQKPFLPLSSDGIDETVVKEEKILREGETVVKEEKILREGETAVSRVVRNFDLNDCEAELGPRVVHNFDLNELPTNDVADEIKHSP